MRFASSSSALRLAAGGDDLELPRLVDHAPEPLRQARKLGVGRDAPLQGARLADVERVALGVEHPVHAGRQGQGGQRPLDDLEALHRRRPGRRPSRGWVMAAD
jgi:hypothetical protein